MNPNWLEFEQPIADLQAKIEELHQMEVNQEVSLADEVQKLEEKSQKLTEKIFSKLSPWQITQIARHIQRPHAKDYIERIVDDFKELHGDRQFKDDGATIAGIGKIGGHPVAIIGQEKGRDTEDKVRCNFGMPRPEGYRKARRIMEMAERFKLPVITLVDTPGAYPGINAEERGQGVAIAENLAVMSRLEVPIISTVIGEGGSGGALAISVADQLMMLQYSVYSVISPEGCASILWKDAKYAEQAAEAMGLNAERLFELGLIHEVIPEPLGGAHRAADEMAETLKAKLIEHIERLKQVPISELVEQRYEQLKSISTV